MFNNKKGLESSIVVAIVIIVSAIILFIAIKAITQAGNQTVDRESCRDSVLLKEKSKLLGKPLAGNLNCETNLVQVNSKDETEIKKTIANEMYDCWYEFGGGQHDFLDSNDFAKGDNYCFVCSRIEFSKNTQNAVPQVSNLFDYLSNEPLPLHNQQTFFDYIYGSNNYAKVSQDGLVLSTSTPLYVVFFGDKRTDAWDNAELTGKVTLGATVFGAIGGCIAGAKIAGLAGAGIGALGAGVGAIPGGLIGATAGCLAGAKIGVGAGLIVGAGTSAYTTAARRTAFYPMLYVGNDQKIIDWCQQ